MTIQLSNPTWITINGQEIEGQILIEEERHIPPENVPVPRMDMTFTFDLRPVEGTKFRIYGTKKRWKMIQRWHVWFRACCVFGAW
jgi:hypothetical protein